MRSHVDRPFVLWFAALFLAGVATSVRSQCEASFQPGEPAGAPRGEASVMQVFDPDGPGLAPAELVIGGALDDGTAAAPLFAYDGTRWRVPGSPPAGRCKALGVFNGELIAAITAPSNPTRSDVAAWNGTTWRALGTVLGETLCMTVFNSRLVVGGVFASVSGVPAANVVQWDGTSWSALGSGITGAPLTMASFGGVLWVGGSITQAGGIPVGNLATWNGSAWAASASVNGQVQAMAVRLATTTTNSFLFVGGVFSSVGTLAARGVASFNPLNGWAAVGTLPQRSCNSLLVRATSSFTFELVAGLTPHVWNGSSWTRLGAGFAVGTALAVFGGRYVAVGYSPYTVRVLDATGTWVGLGGPGIDGPVMAVAATASDVVIGGSFSSISGVAMNGIARGAVGAWQPLGSGVLDGDVHAVTVMSNGDIVAGGSFTSAGGVPANKIARWNGSAWSPLGPGLGTSRSEIVYALAALPDGGLVAAGEFQRAGNVVVNHVARWDGTTWNAMGAGFSMTGFTPHVGCLAVRGNGEVIAGGIFDGSGSTQVLFLARWNGGSWSPMPGEPNGAVGALATLANGDLLVGGFFTAVGTLPTVYLARWNGSTWSAVPGFTHIPFGYDLRVLVPLPDGGALVSGMPTNAVNPRFARYDGQAVTPLPDPGAHFDNGVRASNGDVVFVGDFVRPGNVLSAYVARYVSPCPALADRYGAGCSGAGGLNDLRATRLPVLGGALAARATGMPVLGLALALTGASPTSIPLASLLPQGLPGCSLLASPDILGVVPLANGSAFSSLPIPVSAPLIGVVLHHQFVALELGGGFNIVAATSTNGLRFTIGVF